MCPKHNPQISQPQLPFSETHIEFISLPDRVIDITGQKFNRLMALGPIGRSKHHHIEWLCRCDCGNLSITTSSYLRTGHTKSCGCLVREVLFAANIVHNLSKHPLYGVWSAILSRCTNPNNHAYKRYGGRGITIDKEWSQNFQAFYDHVTQLPHCGEKGYTIDRINNNGNYEPGNVRWATRLEQSQNTRNAKMFTYDGQTKCLAEWSRSTGIHVYVLKRRIKNGWPVDKMLTEPLDSRFSHPRKAKS